MKFLNSVPSLRSRSARRRGQAMLEFALIVTIFLTLVLGMLQFGIYLSTTNALWNLAREGARIAAVKSSTSANANQSIIDTINSRTPPNLDTKKMTITISPNDPSTRVAKTQVTVTIAYDMANKLFIPMPSFLFDKGLGKKYTTYASMMVEGN